MALTITTLTLLNEYINGVMNRADHHGQNVNEIVLTLAGAVIWRATQDVEVRTYNEDTANILWLTVNGHRYAIAYNHQTGNIEIRDRNQNGAVLATFNNSSSANDVKTIFAGQYQAIAQQPTLGYVQVRQDVITSVICKPQLQMCQTNNYQLLHISSSTYFQSAGVTGRWNNNSQPV